MSGSYLDFRDRKSLYGSLQGGTFDILVIGAGITGCGIARDAAMRGLKVALVDSHDIASGTSSRSSKLIHGGLRYLAQGDVGLVKEAASERRVVRRIAPHLTRLNPMVLLARTGKALLKLRAAVWSYERLGRVPKEDLHQVWSLSTLLSREPLLRPDAASGAVVYPEFLTDDARLTLANARGAAQAGAIVATYTAAAKIMVREGRAQGCVVNSTLNGEKLSATISARVIVNAAGPWVDSVRNMEEATSGRLLDLTKGIHLTVPMERLPINHTVVMSTPDRRAIFAVPRGRHVYIGTTDTFHPRPEYWPEINRDDVNYLLEVVNQTFEIEPIGPTDIITTWSGLRPLLHHPGRRPSEISRKEEVIVGPAGVITIAGGKLTCYRPMAARVVDLCERRMGRMPSACRTADVPLPGGDIVGSVDELQGRLEAAGLEPHEAFRVSLLYGSEALEMTSGGWGPEAEALHAVTREGALTLEDFWFRRTGLGLFPPEDERAYLERASRTMAELLGWSEQARVEQLIRCLSLSRLHLKEVK